jgi:hypothetical protein
MDQAMITNLVKSYEEVLKRYGFIKRELSQSQIEEITERLEDHERCHKSWVANEETEGEDMVEIAVYGGGDNVALECMNCHEVIIDSEYFK